MDTVDDCEGQFICWRLGLIEWDVRRSEMTVGNLVKFKSKCQAKSLWGGMTPCSSRGVGQTGDKYFYRKEHKGPYGTACAFVVQKLKNTLGVVSQLKEAVSLYYLELVRLHQKYRAQFCAPKYEVGAEVPVKGH